MALFRLGFRPFFLFGSIFGLLAIAVWVELFLGQINHTTRFAQPIMWHAHEMLFGYTVAIISGFLLTAVRNWTGVSTLNGLALAGLFLLWLSARVLAFFPLIPLASLFLIEMIFYIVLIAALVYPILKAGNHKNLAIISKVLLLMISDAVFFLGAMGVVPDGERMGVTSAVYLIVALMLTLGRRVIPFFIERGVSDPVTLRQSKLIDLSSLILLLLFWLAEIFQPYSVYGAALAAALFLVHAWRLQGWYTNGIWEQPLLWSLFAAYTFIILGFLLRALLPFMAFNPSLIIHAFTVGGIGILTISMMSRVSLGHTGRAIYEPSRLIFWICALLVLGSFIRVLPPLLVSEQVLLWLRLSQASWVIAFGLFVWKYYPVLTKPRVDGQPG